MAGVEVAAYTVPTDVPEADGTLAWESTTLVLVQVHCGDAVGLGYTYGALLPPPTSSGTTSRPW